LVKWVNYDHEHNQWVPEQELQQYRTQIQQYLATKAAIRAAKGQPAQTLAMLWHMSVKKNPVCALS
jgi:Chromo (CHRromatin Organisation MOdifier) domain